MLHWFNERTWMEYYSTTGRIKFWICRFYWNLVPNKSTYELKNQHVFATLGYSDNKHAIHSFNNHENSALHALCMEYHHTNITNQNLIEAQLNHKLKMDQEKNRKHFVKIIYSVQFFCKQNISFQGDSKELSNFHQLMLYFNKLQPSNHALPYEYDSPKIQNEIIGLIAKDVKERNLNKIRNNGYFGVSGDETADNQNQSMFAIIYRTVNNNLEIEEIFSGVHNVPNKKSETLTDTILVSLRCIFAL